MKNILIEGSNATGKTTTMNIVRGLFPESTFIEFHDFYHEHVLNQLNLKALFLPEHWECLTDIQKNDIENYLRLRNDFTFSFIKNQLANRTIIERLILTHAVYSKLILNNDISDYLESKQKELNDSNIVVLLVTCENDVLKNILESNIKNREGRNAPTSQYHLKSVDIGLRKNELYNEYFIKLKNVNKAIIKNYGGSENDLKIEVNKVLASLTI